MNRIKILITYFFLTVTAFSCQKDNSEFLRKNKSKIFSVSADKASIEADGRSAILIVSSISPDADNKTLQFVTNSGLFADSNSRKIQLLASFKNDSLLAYAKLISGIDTSDEVRVTISTVSTPIIDTTLLLTFTRAYPDSIRTEPSLASVKRGYNSEIPLKVLLIRKNGGTVSRHQVAYFSAYDSSNKSIGGFRDISLYGSDSLGLINAIFTLRDTVYVGPIKLVTQTPTKTNPISDTAIVFITN